MPKITTVRTRYGDVLISAMPSDGVLLVVTDPLELLSANQAAQLGNALQTAARISGSTVAGGRGFYRCGRCGALWFPTGRDTCEFCKTVHRVYVEGPAAEQEPPPRRKIATLSVEYLARVLDLPDECEINVTGAAGDQSLEVFVTLKDKG